MIPLVMAGAAAIDYARYALARSELQTALDAALLSAARLPTSTADATVQALAENELDKRINASWMTNSHIDTFRRAAGSTTATATAQVPMTMMRIAGFETMPVTASSQVSVATGKLEIALVLDNSGSMAGSRLNNLVKATNSLLNILESNVIHTGDVKVSIVPFDRVVKASKSYQGSAWLDLSRVTSQECDNYRNCHSVVDWDGCIIDRNQDYDTTDDSYRSAKYPAADCPDGRGASENLATMQPMTTDFSTLRTKANSMVAAGNTNITIGVAWGHAMLSPSGPIAGAVAYGTENLQKIIVLMTDGENTANRWYDNDRYSSHADEINARTELACTDAKNDGIVVYVVNFIDGDSTLLRGCATNDNYFYKVSSVSDLNEAFINIGDDISKLRLSK